ncbi:MAG: tubulin-like doman-containing protein [Cyanobacteria bacterium P01_F01_bin.53]
MFQSSTSEYQFRGVSRTVCIGLGGTGRDILMRIRRLIVDRYRHLDRLPIVKFVHIDTDSSSAQDVSLPTGRTYHGVDLSFDASERVTATMSSAEVTNFVRVLEQRSSYDRQGPYDHIGLWFPPQLLRNIKAIEDGANAVRPIGRLAFFHNYRQIQAAVRLAVDGTIGHESSLLQSFGLEVEPGLNIYVVGSLCGGTGSGMFLDMAYSLRANFGQEAARIIGYWVISPELYGDTPRMTANTYAALKELNHYTMTGTRFTAVYDMRRVVCVDESRPPFDYNYLVSSQTTGSYKILKQGKLCNIVANKIALDFSSELYPTIKGKRDNFKTPLLKLDYHPRPNSQRFMTFGLASIHFPRDTTSQVALNQIGLKLLQFWLNGIGQTPDSARVLEEFLRSRSWQNGLEQRNGIFTKLSESVQYEGRSFSNDLGSWRNKLEVIISKYKNQEERVRTFQQINRALHEQFRRFKPGENETVRGAWLTQVQRTRFALTESLEEDISTLVGDLLQPSNANFSINSLRSVLDALLTRLNSYHRAINESIDDMGGFKREEDLEHFISSITESIDMNVGFQWPFGNTNRRNDHARSAMMQLTSGTSRLVEHNFNLAVWQESAKTIEILQRCVQDYIKLSESFNKLIGDLRLVYSRKESDLQQLNFDEMSGEAIFDQEDIEHTNSALLPHAETKSLFASLSEEIIKGQGGERSLSVLLNQEYLTKEQLQERINIAIERLFGAKSQDIVQSAIRRFMRKYPIATRGKRLSQILAQSLPLLPLSLDDPYFENSPDKESLVVGFKDAEEPIVQQFKDLLRRNPGVNVNNFRPIQTEDEVLVVREYAGFPLRLIRTMEPMRRIYLREQGMADSFLHIARQEEFIDMMPPDALLMEQLEDILYPCIALKLVCENPDDQVYEFQYYDELRDTHSTVALSSEWNQSMELLASRPDIRDSLANILTEAEQRLRSEPSLLEDYIARVREFVAYVDDLEDTHPNSPLKASVVGTRDNLDNFAKQGVLSRYQKKLKDIAAAATVVVNDEMALEGTTGLASLDTASNAKSTEDTHERQRQDVLPESGSMSENPGSTQSLREQRLQFAERFSKGEISGAEFIRLSEELDASTSEIEGEIIENE